MEDWARDDRAIVDIRRLKKTIMSLTVVALLARPRLLMRSITRQLGRALGWWHVCACVSCRTRALILIGHILAASFAAKFESSKAKFLRCALFGRGRRRRSRRSMAARGPRGRECEPADCTMAELPSRRHPFQSRERINFPDFSPIFSRHVTPENAQVRTSRAQVFCNPLTHVTLSPSLSLVAGISLVH